VSRKLNRKQYLALYPEDEVTIGCGRTTRNPQVHCNCETLDGDDEPRAPNAHRLANRLKQV
jgi:hypothetical protein